ncbi:MAG: hypothetical protein Ct9H300mP28_17050 [Pseudomonadota bacterium]|nr:MAG: hypothetical protein Ct9H300mP28_17050 [Pseudomonadota bacterium]
MKTRTKFVIGGAVILAVICLIIAGTAENDGFLLYPAEVLASPAEFEDKTIRMVLLCSRAVWIGTRRLFSFHSNY